MAIIERTHNIVRAQVVVSFLQAQGLNARLLDAETTTMIPFVTGGVRIAVPDDEENQARRLLNEFETAHQEEQDP